MTTYTKLRNLIATLAETEAEIKTLAAINTGDSRGDCAFIQAVQKIRAVIEELEARQGFIVAEEPQFREESGDMGKNQAGGG